MKFVAVWALAFLLLVPSLVLALDPIDQEVTLPTCANGISWGSFQLPHEGSQKVLMIYARILNDGNWGCWTEWPPDDSLPSFFDQVIVPTSNPDSFPEPSTNDYYWKMSSGKYTYYGDRYPQVVETETQDARFWTMPEKNHYILERIANDSTFDFSEFDVSPRDSVIDCVVIIWRNDYCGIALPSLGWGDNVSLNVTTWDGMTIKGCTGIHCPEAGSFSQVMSIICHEQYHKMLEGYPYSMGCFNGGRCIADFDYTGVWSLGTGDHRRGITMCAPERDALCWMDTVQTISSDTVGLKIPDVVESGKAIRIDINDQPGDHNDEYFILENRQRTSWYTQYAGVDTCKDQALPGSGLLIWHVLGYGIQQHNPDWKFLDLESASGLFVPGTPTPDPVYGYDGLDSLLINGVSERYGRFDSLDLYNPEWNNAFTPYTNPNTNGYNEFYSRPCAQNVPTGISVTNVRRGDGDTMIVDIRLDTSRDTIDHNTEWAKWVMLGSDLTVAEGCTLMVDPGAIVNFTPTTDSAAAGVDTTRAELIALGDIVAVGTAGDSIVFRPAGTRRGHTPEADDWYGLRIAQQDTMQSALKYCDVGYGHTGISYFWPTTGPSWSDEGCIEACNIHDNAFAGVFRDMAGYFSKGGILKDCYIHDNGKTMDGYGVLTWQPGFKIISDTLKNNNPCGIGFGQWGGGVVDGSLISQRDLADSIESYGIRIDGLIDDPVRIVFSTITYCSKAGIYLTGEFPGCEIDSSVVKNCDIGFLAEDFLSSTGTPITVLRNTFKKDRIGVYCDPAFSMEIILGDYSTGVAGYNCFDQDTVAVDNQSSDTLKAERNWWGSSQPDTSRIDGLVDYVPYLTMKPPTPFRVGENSRKGGRLGDLEATAESAAGPENNLAPGIVISPNPSHANVTFSLNLTAGTHVSLSIYDIRGRLVAALLDKGLDAGSHTIMWDGRDLQGKPVGPGIYFCRMGRGREFSTSKILLLN